LKQLEITIRRATEKDLPEVVKLASEAMIYSISPFRKIRPELAKEFRKDDLKDLYEWLSPDSPGVICVAETNDGVICGHLIMAHGIFDITGERLGWILDITVKENFKGTGVAQKLHEVAEIILKSKHIKSICLGVTSSNKRAVNFYDKLGYKEEHVQLVKVLSEK
jgi:ribosomal protein S18 acetylase RimI-like enzyme